MQLSKDMIPNYDETREVHGRQQKIPAGCYVAIIQRVSLDITGYGNQCLKVVYDIAEGEYAKCFSDMAGDPEQDWKHNFEIDIQQSNGGLLNTFIKAVQLSNPGYVFNWDDPNNIESLVGRTFGVVFQQRLYTLTRGANKGQTRDQLDMWDTVDANAIRTGVVNFVPPVNDKRTNKGEAAQGAGAPVAVPPTIAPVSNGSAAAPQQPAYTPIQPAQSAAAPQPGAQMPAMQQPAMQAPAMQAPVYQQPAQQPAPQMNAQTTVQAVTASDLYDSDIPF